MNWHITRIFNGKTSIFLDAIRFIAAFTVFLAHAQAIWFPEKELDPTPSHLSHGAVVVFFVLSGFVIAHTTTNKKRGIKEYMAARFSRLYSIFFPAIIITIICSFVLYYLHPVLWHEYDRGKSFFRYSISLIFCNEIWLFSSAPKINGPIWSLSYEFWYYMIFGLFFYRKKGLPNLIIPALACLIAGPKIILMMFIWLTGWLVYFLPRPKLKPEASWLVVFFLMLCSILLMLYLPAFPFAVNTGKLHWADQFITDWIIGLVIGGALLFLPNVPIQYRDNSKAVLFFRKLGDLTFPVYVLHFPLLVLAKSLIPNHQSRANQFFIGVIFVLAVVSIIGLYLESKRKYWNRFFTTIIEKIHFAVEKAKVNFISYNSSKN
ncbi:MAG TPA: acyltransferase [Segetibacter sp.]